MIPQANRTRMCTAMSGLNILTRTIPTSTIAIHTDLMQKCHAAEAIRLSG
jgi:hypothetical protein